MATTTIYVGKDAYGVSNYGDTNYGATEDVSFGTYNNIYIGFLEFDLSSLSGATINSATLNIYVYTIINAGANTYRRMTSQFTENTVTYNTHPSTTDTNLFTGSAVDDQWNVYTCTDMLSDALTGGFLGIEISGGGQVGSYSKEYSGGTYKAYLSVDYTAGCSTYDDVYVNSSTGSDAACGATSGTPVQTFARAYALLNSGGTIHCLNSGADFSAETVTLNKSFSIDLNGSSGNFYMPKAS